MSDLVEIVLRLRGARQFVGDMDKSTHGVTNLGKATEDTGKKTKTSWKQLGKFAANSAAVYGATKFLKGSADATQDLAKGTMALTRSTGMDAKSASAWVSVLKTRGINTKQFNVGMVKMAKTMEAARGGNEKAAASLADLGVNQDMIMKGDVQGAIMRSADAFALMTNPAEKAAKAQALFGKQGQALLPIMSGGSKGIEEQLGMAAKYGAVLDDKAVGGTKDLIAQQRELQLAQAGVKVQIGSALLPVMASFASVLQKVVSFLGPLLKNSTALTTVIVLLTTAFIAYKTGVVIATVASWNLGLATKALAAGQWLLNAALSANPIGLIIIALVALAAGFYVAYKKVDWFRNAVNAAFQWLVTAARNVFGWIKSHWPLLVSILGGPFGLAFVLIAKNFDKIKSGVSSVWNWVKSTFGKIKGFIKGVFGGGFVSGIGRGLADWLNSNTPFGDRVEFSILGKHVGFTIPALAEGGRVVRPGAALVGERGPEIVSLPAPAQVIPNGGVGAAGAQTIVTQVFLDRRQIAEAVGAYTSDRIARR